MNQPATILIVGAGNELLGDEGFGVHVARSLMAAKDSLPPHVGIVEAGTSLFDLLPEMATCSEVILVDAIRGGGPPGSLYQLDAGDCLTNEVEANRALSLHQWDLVETLRAAELMGLRPRALTIVGAEPETLEPGIGLSPRLADAADRLLALITASVRCAAAGTGGDRSRDLRP